MNDIFRVLKIRGRIETRITFTGVLIYTCVIEFQLIVHHNNVSVGANVSNLVDALHTVFPLS